MHIDEGTGVLEQEHGRQRQCMHFIGRRTGAAVLVLLVAAQTLAVSLAYIPPEGDEGGAQLASGGGTRQVVELGGLPQHAVSKISGLLGATGTVNVVSDDAAKQTMVVSASSSGHRTVDAGKGVTGKTGRIPAHIGDEEWNEVFGPFTTSGGKFAEKVQQIRLSHLRQTWRRPTAPAVHSVSPTGSDSRTASWANGWGLHAGVENKHARYAAFYSPDIAVVPRAKSFAARSTASLVLHTSARNAAGHNAKLQGLRRTVDATAERGGAEKSSMWERTGRGNDADSWIAPALARVLEGKHRLATEGPDIDGDNTGVKVTQHTPQPVTAKAEREETAAQGSNAQAGARAVRASSAGTHQQLHTAPAQVVESVANEIASVERADEHRFREREHVRERRLGPHFVAPRRAAGSRGPGDIGAAIDDVQHILDSSDAVGPHKAPIAEAARELESRIGLRGTWQQKEEEDEDEEEDGDAVSPADEVRDFETDIERAFDWNKVTFATIPLHQWAWWVAALFVVLTCIISGQLIWAHLNNYEHEVQKYVVRIIYMAPIYSVVALLSLTFDNAAPLLNVVRDCYEAFVLWNFVKVMDMMALKKQMKLPFPLHWMEPWAMGDELFYNCKFGVLQYVLVIPICAVVTFVTIAAGAYDGPEWYSMDLWITLVAISSATWAIYCLITFYLAMQEEIENSVNNALGKFLVVKAVVFLCFYQDLALHLVLLIGYIPSSDTYSEKRFINAIENWLICLEMFIIAICFSLVYPVEEIAEMKKLNNNADNTAAQGASNAHAKEARASSPDYGSLTTKAA